MNRESFTKEEGRKIVANWLESVKVDPESATYADSLEAALQVAVEMIDDLLKIVNFNKKEISALKKGKKLPGKKQVKKVSGFDSKSVRVGLGMSQEEFARKLDVSLSAVASWDSGRRQPTKAMQEKILRVRK